jgi:hypothetical protein
LNRGLLPELVIPENYPPIQAFIWDPNYDCLNGFSKMSTAGNLELSAFFPDRPVLSEGLSIALAPEERAELEKMACNYSSPYY